jgi:uncharacterized protein YjiS (DUF1127 family)
MRLSEKEIIMHRKLIRKWRNVADARRTRQQSHRQMRRLSDRMLRDIGVTRIRVNPFPDLHIADPHRHGCNAANRSVGSPERREGNV